MVAATEYEVFSVFDSVHDALPHSRAQKTISVRGVWETVELLPQGVSKSCCTGDSKVLSIKTGDDQHILR